MKKILKYTWLNSLMIFNSTNINLITPEDIKTIVITTCEYIEKNNNLKKNTTLITPESIKNEILNELNNTEKATYIQERNKNIILQEEIQKIEENVKSLNFKKNQ